MNTRKGFMRVVLLGLISVLSVLALAGINFAAEKFPCREVVIVVTFTAGGPVDLTTRVLAEYLKKEIGVPVIVENRPEAGTVKGVVDVYKAKPDGCTLLSNLFPNNAISEGIYKAPFKILELTYLPAFSKTQLLLIVNKNSPYNTLIDLVEASKRKPLNCSTAGGGTLSQFFGLVLKEKVGINLEVVPFKGSAPAIMAMLGGNVDLTTLPDIMVLAQLEKVRPLAIFAKERSRKFPGVPTFKELGYDVPTGDSILGISGPPGLPEGVRRILSDALAKIIRNPEMARKIDELGPSPIYMTGPEFRDEAESSFNFVKENRDIFLGKK